MKRVPFFLGLLAVVVCTAMAWAQARSAGGGGTPYQPAVPAATTNVYGGGGWPGYGGGTTAAGSAMSGMSQVISSAGQYNLATSAAAVNMTQAEHNQLQNDMLATNTYFEMRATNRAAREAEQGPRPSMEQLARIAKQGVPRPLTTGQWDPVTGRLDWPSALQQPSFAPQRSAVDELFAKFATYGGLAYSDQTAVRQTIDTMAGELKAQMRQIPPPDYMVCKDFLRSLMYAATKTFLQ